MHASLQRAEYADPIPEDDEDAGPKNVIRCQLAADRRTPPKSEEQDPWNQQRA
jgi:hypothetical protein